MSEDTLIYEVAPAGEGVEGQQTPGLTVAPAGYLVVTEYANGRADIRVDTEPDLKAYVEECIKTGEEMALLSLQVYRAEAVYVSPEGERLQRRLTPDE